jgi:hypothetical protein
VGVYSQERKPDAAAPTRTFEDYLKEEQVRAAAERAMLQQGEKDALAAAGPEPTQPAPASFGEGDDTLPPEVFIELSKKFKALKRGSPERNYGIVETERDGKKYKYDAYAGQERAGFIRDRDSGPALNFLLRFGTEFAGDRPAVRQSMQRRAAERLQEKNLGADEVYRQAMLEAQGRNQKLGDARQRARDEFAIGTRAYDRAQQRYLQSIPDPAKGRTPAQEAVDEAQAEFYKEQAAALRRGLTKNGTKPGGEPKPDYTPDQAFTNMHQTQDRINRIQAEVQMIDKAAPEKRGALMTDILGAREQKDVEIYDAQGKFPSRVIPAAEVQAERTKLMKELEYQQQQLATFREIVRNGNTVPDAAKGDEPFEDQFSEDDPPPTQEEMQPFVNEDGVREVPAGYEGGGTIDPDQAGKLERAAPSASGVPTAGKGRRPKPPPEVFAKLSYRDQLYYQLAEEQPEASDRELKMMVMQILNPGVPVSRGGEPAKPAPMRGH